MKRPLMIVGFSYLTALAVAYYFAPKICFVLSGIFIFLALVLVLLKFPKKMYAFSKIVPTVLATSAIAFAVNGFYFDYNYKPILALDGETAQITAEVLRETKINDEKHYYEIKVISSSIEKNEVLYLNPIKAGTKLKLCYKGKLSAEYFDIVDFEGYLYKNSATFTYDYEKSNLSKGILLNVYTDSAKVSYPEKYPPLRYIYKLRDNLLNAIRENVGGNIADVSVAILTSQKSESFYSNFNYFSTVGLSHIFSVSGLHLSIVLGGLYAFLTKLKQKHHIKGIIIIITAVFVMIFTGFLPSVMRSGIMAILFYMGDMFRKRADAKNSLGIAVLLILIFSPYSANDISLVLSVLSTLSIILFGSKMSSWFEQNVTQNTVVCAVVEPMIITLSALLLTFPVTVVYFSGFSLISPIANLLVSPLVPLFLTLSLMVGFLGLFSALSPFALLLGLVTRLVGDVITGVAYILSKLPYAFITVSDDVVKIILCTSATIIVMVAVFLKNSKAVRAIVLSTILAIFIYLPINEVLLAEKLIVAIPDTSAGSAVVVTQGKQAVVMGLGGNKYEGSTAVDYLKSRGINEVKFLLTSYISNTSAKCVSDVLAKTNVLDTYIDVSSSQISDIVQNASKDENIHDLCDMSFEFENGAKIEILQQKSGSVALITYKGKTVLYINGYISNRNISQQMIGCDIMISNGFIREENLKVLKPRNLIICDEIKRNELLTTAKQIKTNIIDVNLENSLCTQIGANGKINITI